MDYKLYKQAIKHDEKSPAREALVPYWESIIRIAQDEDPYDAIDEEAVCVESDGTLTLALGGPRVEFTRGGEIRASWGDGWIYSQARTYEEETAARVVLEILNELPH